jgi:hypothetical protein
MRIVRFIPGQDAIPSNCEYPIQPEVAESISYRSLPVHDHLSSTARHSVPSDPVLAFLSSLGRATPEMAEVMYTAFQIYGVRTSNDLDQLAEMTDLWGEAEQYLNGLGLTRFHWLVIREGLLARATASQR